MCDAALSLQLALPGARRPRGLGTHPRAQGWPRAGLGRGGRSLPGRAGQQCQGFVTRAASPCLAACTGAPGREARSGTSSRSLLDGDTGSPRGHGMRRAAPSRGSLSRVPPPPPCTPRAGGTAAIRAAPSPSQGIGFFFWGAGQEQPPSSCVAAGDARRCRTRGWLPLPWLQPQTARLQRRYLYPIFIYLYPRGRQASCAASPARLLREGRGIYRTRCLYSCRRCSGC